MEKFNVTSVNHLLSFDKADEISKMSKQSRLKIHTQIKKQAAYFMLSVSRAVENKDYKTAKSILIYIADSCSCIEDPDFEVKYLIQVCCHHLAFIRQMEGFVSSKDKAQTKSIQLSSQLSQNPIFVFKYNKFKGEFQCDEQNKNNLNQTVLFYMSKLNSILFNYQNTENNHSLIAMLKSYYAPFLMVFINVIILFIVLFSGLVEELVGVNNSSLMGQLPIIIGTSLFLIPVLKIYTKEPSKKDSMFFEKRLGQQILKINQQCAENNENIKFFMPEGIEINVQVGYDEQIKK